MYRFPFFNKPSLLAVCTLLISACSREAPTILVTIADARVSKAQLIDTGEPGDTVGDILAFDQPLLDEHCSRLALTAGPAYARLQDTVFNATGH